MASKGGNRSSTARILLAVLGVLLLILLLAGAFTAWLFTTESGARTALPMLAERTDGAVDIDGVHGRLAGPLHIERVVVERTNDRLELTDVRLDWHPSALLQDRLLHLSSLQIGHLAVISKIDQTPEPDTGMPEDIGLPVQVRADDIRVDGGEIRRGPAQLAELGPLALSLNYADQRYQLDLERLGAKPQLDDGTASAGLSGTFDLSSQRPFPLTGRFAFDSEARFEEREIGATGKVTLDGSLEELRTGLDLLVNQTPVAGSAVLRPFSDQILGRAQLDTEALDLSALEPSLPQTKLDVALNVGKDGAGRLNVRNHAPGTYENQRLPLTAFDLRFHEREDGFEFEHILARLGVSDKPGGTAGELNGNGRYVDGKLELSLATKELDLQRIDPQLRATSLAGTINASHVDGRQEFTVALSEPLGPSRVTLDAHGVLADAELEIRRAELKAGDGRLQVTGSMALEGTQAFAAEGEVTHFRLHDFGKFEEIPEMDLNGNFSLEGERAPELEADLKFEIADSRLAGQPLSGSGQASLRGDRLEVPRLALASGANRLNAKGRLAEGDANLTFSLQAPKLAQLGPNFGGSIHIDGVARGSLEQPHVTAEWRAEDARIPGDLRIGSMQGKADIRLDQGAPFMLRTAEATLNASGVNLNEQQADQIDARMRFSPEPDAPLSLEIDAQGVTAGDSDYERITASVEGTTARHKIDTEVSEPGQKWNLRASGGLDSLSADARWDGRIEQLEGSGRLNARMTKPAPLQLSGERTTLEGMQIDIEGGRLVLDRFARDEDGIDTRGRLEQLDVGQILRFADPAPPVKTDLVLSGEWDLKYAEALSGSVSVRRESGDVTVLGSTPVTLGLNTLRADLNATNGRLTLDLQAAGERLGRIAMEAATRLGTEDNPLALDPGAPLDGSATVSIPSLAWVAPLVEPVMAADGSLQAAIDLAGTVSDPNVSGTIIGDELRVAHAEFGLDLRQGTLRSQFRDDQLVIEDLAFEGPQGNIHVSGPIDLGGDIAARLLLRADRFAALNRPDRRLTLSGESRLSWQKGRASINGDFTVDSGFFDIGQADRPRLSEDVVIVGKDEDGQGTGVAADIDVTIRLGGDVVISGRGLNASLAGSVRLLSDAGEPLQAQGTVRVAEGTFSAYGRELEIEKGDLRFTGPLNNPALDILAMRRGQEVEAGVSVRGTVLEPRVTLVSEPSVPDAEKLAWLVIGRSLASAGESDMGSLQSAAGALLAQGAAAGVQSRIANAFGLDTFNVGTTDDNLEQRIITVGKQISSRLYLGYQHGLESANSVVQLRYSLTPSLSVEAEAGGRSALSLFYNITFD